MNKAVAAGIGIGIVLIAIAALMMNQTDESNTQVDLSEDVEITADESKSYDVVIEEGVKVGDKPP